MQLHDGLHRIQHGIFTLLDGIDKPFGRIDLIFEKLPGSPVGFFLRHFGKNPVHAQGGAVSPGELHLDVAIVEVAHQEVGLDGMVMSRVAAQARSGLGIKRHDHL